jgi:2-polyprenyl-6-methoxyphenol hydroxylase-like FAD-dependent oxidoreductase
MAGVDAEVYEAYDVSSEGVGAYLSLAQNGLYGLELLGLQDSLRGKGFETPWMEFYSGTGKRLGRIGDARRGLGMRTVMRSDLYGVLRAEAESRGVAVHYGKRLASAEMTGDGVRVGFADGTEVEADLLIGADGLHSPTRKLIDPAAPSPRYLGLLNTGGYASGIEVDGEPGVANMIFGRRLFFCYFRNPNGEVWWFANPPSADELSREELGAITPEQWRERLLSLLSGDDTPAERIVRATQEIVAPWCTYDLPGVPQWRNDRMVLVGDAAHAVSPASGQGASMAIEDAVVLAKCLRDMPDVAAALTRYEELRRQRVERIVAQGKRNGDQKAVGPVARVVRDLTLPLVFRMMNRRADAQNWMTDFRIDWAERVA